MTQEEKNCIEEARNGSQKAYRTLYNTYYRLIRYIIYNSIKDEEVTTELVEITFIKAFEKLNSFTESISFEAWLKTVAVNTVIDYLRRKKNENINISLDDENYTVQITEENRDPESDIIKSESLELLRIALSKLRYKYKNILELRYFKELSYEQISKELGVPVGTVKSDLNKAKRRLKQIFQKLSNIN